MPVQLLLYRNESAGAAADLSRPPERRASAAADDAVWGDGGDGRGQNRRGRLLMKVRDKLRCQQQQPGLAPPQQPGLPPPQQPGLAPPQQPALPPPQQPALAPPQQQQVQQVQQQQ